MPSKPADKALFIYRDDENRLWSARVPADVGNHSLLGFEPTNRTDLPALRYPIRYTFVGAVRPRHIQLRAPNADKSNWPYTRTFRLDHQMPSLRCDATFRL
jgi:hypothetical protein